MNKQDEEELVNLLAKLEPGFLPYQIFKEIARLVVMPVIEFVPLRIKDGLVEVLLLERDETDDIWPGEVHTPGTVIRATDKGGKMHKAFERVLHDELGGIEVSDPHFVGTLFHEGRRGAEQAQIYWIEVLEEPKIGKFYLASKLPENMMDQQIKFVSQAVESFKKRHGSRYY